MSEENYKIYFDKLFNECLDAVARIDPKGVIKDINHSYKKLYDYSYDEIVGHESNNFMANKDEYSWENDLDMLKRGQTIVKEIRIINGRNELLQIRRREIPIIEKGNLIEVLAYEEDISNRFESEEIVNLKLSALDATANAVIVSNTRGDVIWVNPAFTEITGYEHEEILYKNLDLIRSEKQSVKFFQEIRDHISKGKVWKGEVIKKRKDGSEYIVDQTITPVFHHANNISYFIFVEQDITDKKKTEEKNKIQREQLIQADKMIALGTLVSGVAHEINNPNNFIMLNTPILKKSWKDLKSKLDQYYEEFGDFKVSGMFYSKFREHYERMCDNIMEGSRRIQKIVEDLKRFSRKNVDEVFEPINVNEVIKSASNLVGNLIKKSTDYFSLDLDESIPMISANFQYLEQILINFITNACQSLSSKEKGVIISSGKDETGESIIISVIDEGKGIKENDLARITDPFFTTKREAGGTGLGLSVSSKIIKDLGGKLNFRSEINKGTTAEIIIPIKKS